MKRIQLIFWCVLIGYAGFAQDAQLDAAKKKIVANDFAGAKADLTKIIDGNPKNKLALNLRGQARYGLNDFYGAVSDYTFAIDIDSTFAEAFNNRGESKMS